MNRTVGQYTPATVLCWSCSRPIDGTQGLTLCIECIKSRSRLADDVPREYAVQFCRNCERFLLPPSSWVQAAPESRELLAILLKKVPLKDKRLVDAAFEWTEPHSRRIKVGVTLQGMVEGTDVVVQERFTIEYFVVNCQCSDCARSYTVHTWRAAVQVRQKVDHKRTFLYLEQLLLKYGAHSAAASIQAYRDGVDFYFGTPNDGLKLIDFIARAVPVRTSKSRELIGSDTHSGTSNYKFSHAVEIAPICKDDLVVLPKLLAQKLGNIPRLVLCSRISTAIQFINPNTLQLADLDGSVYWRQPFLPLLSKKAAQEFIVLDVDILDAHMGRHVLADATIARSSDMSQIYLVRTHLGAVIHPGDTVMGYSLCTSNLNSDSFDELNDVPDVVLISKVTASSSSRRRAFKLKRMPQEHMDADVAPEAEENEYEEFLQELEQDPEMRAHINLYKDPAYVPTNDGANEGPTIDLSELIDDLEIND